MRRQATLRFDRINSTSSTLESLEPRMHLADISGSYAWKQVPTGGGGFVTGMVIHPTAADVMYVRTDVGGAYKWNAATQTWRQLVTDASMPDEVRGGKYGVESIALDRLNPSVLYLTAAPSGGSADGALYKSTNGGQTFIRTGLSSTIDPNGDFRTLGERVAVDPNNSNVVYAGTATGGLKVSTNGGTSFAQAGGPLATDHVITVAFEPSGGTLNGKTRVIYAVTKSGATSKIYRTSDAGATWSQINNGVGPSGDFRDLDIGSNGTLWVTQSGGTWRYANAAWSQAHARSANSVVVSPQDPNAVYITEAGNNGRTFRTTNGGASWTTINMTRSSPEIPWLTWTGESYMSVGEIVADPHVAGRFWFAQGIGVWQVNNWGTGTSNTWVSKARGIEEMVAHDAVVSGDGKLITALWDRSGFRHESLEQYPGTHLPGKTTFSSGWDLAVSPQNPNFITLISEDYRDGNPHFSGYSSDGGKTWTTFASITNGTHPADLHYGNMAISATDTNRLVWLPGNKKVPYYSPDRGATWYPTTGAPVNVLDAYHRYAQLLVADPLQGNVFYLWDGRYASKDVYKSTDYGQSWTKVCDNGPGGSDSFVRGQLEAVPGRSGHLWAATTGNGLSRSTDGGVTWSTIAGFSLALEISFGKAAAGSTDPAAYVMGTYNGDYGLWRSTNMGATWDKIGTYPLGIFDNIKTIVADPYVFGRLYVGFAGNSFAYGDPVAAPVQTGTVEFDGLWTTATAGTYTESGLAIDTGGRPVKQSTVDGDRRLSTAKWNTRLTLRRAAGGTFDLDSLQVIPTNSDPADVVITGWRSDGSTLTHTVVPGSSILRTLNWTGLTEVTIFSTRHYSIDKISFSFA
jgi:hypothetical protein